MAVVLLNFPRVPQISPLLGHPQLQGQTSPFHWAASRVAVLLRDGEEEGVINHRRYFALEQLEFKLLMPKLRNAPGNATDVVKRAEPG